MNLDNLHTDSVNTINRQMERQIEFYNNSIKNERKKAKQRVKNLAVRVDIVKTLVATGIIGEEADGSDLVHYCMDTECYAFGNNLNVTGKLHTLRTLYGSEFVELMEDSKEEYSAKDNEVKVYLKRKPNYAGPRMFIVQKLPEDSPCQYETRTTTDKTLVCRRQS